MANNKREPRNGRNPDEDYAHRFGLTNADCLKDPRIGRLVHFKQSLDEQVRAAIAVNIKSLLRAVGYSPFGIDNVARLMGFGPDGPQPAGAQPAPDVEKMPFSVAYQMLAQLAPSPVVDLNRAVAVAIAFGPAAGRRLVDELTREPSLRAYHLLPSVRGDLLSKLGRTG